MITATLRRQVELCGVFVNAPMEEIVAVSEELGLTLLAVARRRGPLLLRGGGASHGGSRGQGPAGLRPRLTSATRPASTPTSICSTRALSPPGARGCGGARGRRSTGGCSQARRSKTPLILSGGLTPENVTEAIERVRPFAVDSASGTESAPGRKDPKKLRDFFASVERAAFSPEAEQVRSDRSGHPRGVAPTRHSRPSGTRRR